MSAFQYALDTCEAESLTDVYGADIDVQLDTYHESVRIAMDVPAYTGHAARHLDAAGARALAARLLILAGMIDEAEGN